MNEQTLKEIETLGIDFGDSIPCSFNHEHPAVPQAYRSCSVEVTHLGEASCGREAAYLCGAAAEAMNLFIRAGQVTRCKTCGQPPATHWTVRVI